jgi:succinate-acetate transporter protein
LILSLYNVNARGIATPNVIVGMALFCGGLAQLLAGMWEFATGNTFGATGKFSRLLVSFLDNNYMVVLEQHSRPTVLSGSRLPLC